jgi:hypothetical protein
MPFKALLDTWSRQRKPVLTERTYTVRLPFEDAARLHALVDLYPDLAIDEAITDLLAVALADAQAAMPYVAGDTVIREDDHGDPVYEDVGLTPKFLELVRKHSHDLEKHES